MFRKLELAAMGSLWFLGSTTVTTCTLSLLILTVQRYPMVSTYSGFLSCLFLNGEYAPHTACPDITMWRILTQDIRIRHVCSKPSFVWDSGPHACAVNVLSTEATSPPTMGFLGVFFLGLTDKGRYTLYKSGLRVKEVNLCLGLHQMK